jgi:hypothetical membrane protein
MRLLSRPNTFDVLMLDALLFVLPSCYLARACGVSKKQSEAVLVVYALALLVGAFSPDLRRLVLIFGVMLAQGASAAIGVVLELRAKSPLWERRAAVVLAALAVFGGLFVRRWEHVAAIGAAGHAFVLLAYLIQRARENRGNPRDLAHAPMDLGAPASEGPPRTEGVEQAEGRPEARREDPGPGDRPEHDHHPPGRDG